MDYDSEFKRILRHEKKLQNLGSDCPRCVLCGTDDAVVLELHHIAGRANSKVTLWVCRNCHAQASDRQQDLDPDLRSNDRPADPLLKQAAMFQGIAVLLIIAAIVLFAWSEWNVQASGELVTQYGADWYKSISAQIPP